MLFKNLKDQLNLSQHSIPPLIIELSGTYPLAITSLISASVAAHITDNWSSWDTLVYATSSVLKKCSKPPVNYEKKEIIMIV